MIDVDDIVIEALRDAILYPTMIAEFVDEALSMLQSDSTAHRLGALEAQLATVEQERSRLVAPVARGTAGGPSSCGRVQLTG